MRNNLGKLSFEEELGSRIRRMRDDRNMSRESLAKILGCDRNTLLGYESGKTIPNAKILNQCCQIFGCNIDYLFNGTFKTGLDQRALECVVSLSELSGMEREFFLFQIECYVEGRKEHRKSLRRSPDFNNLLLQ